MNKVYKYKEKDSSDDDDEFIEHDPSYDEKYDDKLHQKNSPEVEEDIHFNYQEKYPSGLQAYRDSLDSSHTEMVEYSFTKISGNFTSLCPKFIVKYLFILSKYLHFIVFPLRNKEELYLLYFDNSTLRSKKFRRNFFLLNLELSNKECRYMT